jgi:DNA primase large subunit
MTPLDKNASHQERVKFARGCYDKGMTTSEAIPLMKHLTDFNLPVTRYQLEYLWEQWDNEWKWPE